MDLRELVEALRDGRMLDARQWVADAVRASFDWSAVALPELLAPRDQVIAASIVELLSERAGQPPPAWTRSIGPADREIWLVRAAATMPRLARLCREEGPEPLRKRRVFAPPNFLTAA